ncbi:MAG: signal peptidase II [Planctomycetota bacterium]
MPTEAGTRARLNRRLALVGVALAAGTLDQFTKWLAFEAYDRWLDGNHVDALPLVKGFLRIAPTFNRGAAFSLLALVKESNLILLAVSVAIMGVLFWLADRHYAHAPLWPFGLLIGGALANVADRIRFGHVEDFLTFEGWFNWWPTFNVADVEITVGAVVLIVWSLFLEPRAEGPAAIETESE